MVGFTRDPTFEEDIINQQPPTLKHSEDPLPVDPSGIDLDDFCSSFFDFESITGWIEEYPILDTADVKTDPERVDSIEMYNVESSRNITPDNFFGDGIGKLVGGLEELNESSAVEVAGVNVNGEKIGEIMNGATMGIDGSDMKSNVASIAEDAYGVKSDKQVGNGGDESGSSSDSESESESESSSSFSSSSSSDEEEDDDDNADEEEEEAVKEELEGIDMEEGEIRDSDDVEKMVTWNDDEYDEDEGIGAKGGSVKSKNELKDLPPVPPVNVTLHSHHHMLAVGVISSIIGAQVIVEGLDQHNPLNEGTILWITESRSPLGLVDDIFGPVQSPYYVIRYNSENELPAGIKQGTAISFVPEFANHVLKDSNLYRKGYDASGENDEEVSDEAEFSDDEKEAEYRKMLKMKKRCTKGTEREGERKDRKNFRNRGGSVQNSPFPSVGSMQNNRFPENFGGSVQNNQFPRNPPHAPKGVPQLVTNQNQQCTLPPTTPADSGNFPSSFGVGQNYINSLGFVSPFPQLVPAPPGFLPPPNVVWTNGMPCQQGMVFPNGMPWPQQNPLSNGIPFPQQFVPSQGAPSNVVLPPGSQSNFCAAPSFGPWSGSFGQNGQNQPSGFQRPHIPGNTEFPQKFNQGTYQGRGQGTYHQGGRQFGSGRGWQQSK